MTLGTLLCCGTVTALIVLLPGQLTKYLCVFRVTDLNYCALIVIIPMAGRICQQVSPIGAQQDLRATQHIRQVMTAVAMRCKWIQFHKHGHIRDIPASIKPSSTLTATTLLKLHACISCYTNANVPPTGLRTLICKHYYVMTPAATADPQGPETAGKGHRQHVV